MHQLQRLTKMLGKQIQTHRCPFLRPISEAHLCMSVDLLLNKTSVEYLNWTSVGHSGLPGHRL